MHDSLELGKNSGIKVAFERILVERSVLMSTTIDTAVSAYMMANLLTKKYGTETKIDEPTSFRSGYVIWLYDVPLSSIEDHYNEDKNQYIFSLEELIKTTPEIDIKESIQGLSAGDSIHPFVTDELLKQSELLLADTYYDFYLFNHRFFFRTCKDGTGGVALGEHTHINFVTTLFNRLLVSEDPGFIRDRDIYSSALDGTDRIPLRCISNQKACIDGHEQSIDKIISMSRSSDRILVEVCRIALHGKYNYTFPIVYENGAAVAKNQHIL